jgi:hypothetical protein
MRLPRVRITVRRIMMAVAMAAVAIIIMHEFYEGIPPRFIMRSLPGRIKRLQPGMAAVQARDILGLKRSWVLGGLGVRRHGMMSGAYMTTEHYQFENPTEMVLQFQHNKLPPWDTDESSTLYGAIFRVGGRIIAESSTDPWITVLPDPPEPERIASPDKHRKHPAADLPFHLIVPDPSEPK